MVNFHRGLVIFKPDGLGMGRSPSNTHTYLVKDRGLYVKTFKALTLRVVTEKLLLNLGAV